MRGLVLISDGPCGTVEVRSPFEARDVIKSLPAPARSWDKRRKLWLVDAGLAPILTVRLRDDGFAVDRVRPRSSGTAVRPPRSSTWADQMYAEVGPDLGDKAYQALVRVLHPDAGGDTEAMQSLNSARDRAHGRNRR